MDFELLLDGQIRTLSLEKSEKGYLASFGEETLQADVQWVSPNCLSLVMGDSALVVYIVSDNDKYLCYVNGEQWLVQEPVEDKEVFDEDEGMSSADKLQIKAPMPGKVIKILVKDSDEVKKNQTLVVVEAMKMENELRCSIDGVVKKVHVSEGLLVDVDKILVELEEKG